MGVTVVVNTRTVVHRGSGGKAHGFGDVCKTADDQIVPFVNLAQSEDAADCAATVSADGHAVMKQSSFIATSTGDEPGVKGGTVSGRNMGRASFITYSTDVRIEGEPVPRALDTVEQNHGSPPQVVGVWLQDLEELAARDLICELFCACLEAGQRTTCVQIGFATPWTEGRGENRTRHWHAWAIPGLYAEYPFDGVHPITDCSFPPPQWSTDGGPCPPAGDYPPIAGSRRPDLVYARDPSRPPGPPDNIRAIYEIKFPGDRWRLGQQDAYTDIAKAGGGQVYEISVATCGCIMFPVPPPHPVREEVHEYEDDEVRVYEEAPIKSYGLVQDLVVATAVFAAINSGAGAGASVAGGVVLRALAATF